MNRFLPIALAMVLAACGQQNAQQESAEDFAARIGQGGQAAAPDTAGQPSVAQAAPPAGADVTQLQKLGNIGGVDLGPRVGSCTLMVGENEVLMAGGPAGQGKGRGVIRVGNGLALLDTGQGGFATVKKGGTFTGEGFTVSIAPAAGEAQQRPASVVVNAAGGKSQAYSGNWICS